MRPHLHSRRSYFCRNGRVTFSHLIRLCVVYRILLVVVGAGYHGVVQVGTVQVVAAVIVLLVGLIEINSSLGWDSIVCRKGYGQDILDL